MIYDLKYPKSKIAVEKEFKLNGLKKRFDLLIFDKDTQPFFLLEFKSQKESLTEKVLEQCLQYNMKFAVPYLGISNGDFTKAWSFKVGISSEMEYFPKYEK